MFSKSTLTYASVLFQESFKNLSPQLAAVLTPRAVSYPNNTLTNKSYSIGDSLSNHHLGNGDGNDNELNDLLSDASTVTNVEAANNNHDTTSHTNVEGLSSEEEENSFAND